MRALPSPFRLLLVSLLVSALLAPPARAQSFAVPASGDLILVLLDEEGNVRFTLSGFLASWENPFRTRVSTFSPALLQVVSRDVELVGKSSASPLLEGIYHLSPQWAVGIWYNPIKDDAPERLVQVADVPLLLDLSRSADLMDFHVIYYGPRGLSAQLGYYRERGTLTVGSRAPVPGSTVTRLRDSYGLKSWNVWVTQRLDVKWRERLVTPFVWAGYHTASELNHAVSLMLGVAVTFNERFSFSGSLWRFDLSNPATRITAGVVYRFE